MNKVQKLWPTLKRLLAYGSPYRKPLGLAVLMLWVAAAAEVAGPILVSYFIDNYVAKGQLPLTIVGGLAAAYILLELLAAALHYFQALLFNQAAVGVVQRLRTDVMDAALRQPLSAFDTQPVGQLISRVTNDTEVIKDLYVMVVSTVLKSAALIGAMLVAMFSLDWRMALVAVCIFPAVFVGVALGLMLHQHVPAVPAAITVSCAIMGLVLVVTRDGWLSLFMAVAVVPDLHLLPVLCIVMLPAWLALAGKPLMLVNRRQPPHDD